MKRNLLQVVLANTSPISEAEFNEFLLRRHGSASRENASSDLSMLGDNEKKFLKAPSHPEVNRPRKRAEASQETESK